MGNRYLHPVSRAIPDSGPITATMIKTEWGLAAGPFRESADGAALISFPVNSRIAHSDFKGKAAANGLDKFENDMPCYDPNGGRVSIYAQTSVLEHPCSARLEFCGGTSNMQSYAYWYSHVLWIDHANHNTGATNSPAATSYWCSYLPIGDQELAPGAWRCTGTYEMVLSTDYCGRYTNGEFKVNLASSKSQRGNTVVTAGAKQVSSSTVGGGCYYTHTPDDGNGGFGRPSATYPFSMDFTVSQGNGWCTLHFKTHCNEYHHGVKKIKDIRLVKIG